MSTATKTLYLVRHGKAGWRHHEVNDADRPLKKKGVEESRMMALHLRTKDTFPDLIITSPAKRAVQTARVFSEELGISDKYVQQNISIYSASLEEVLTVILGLDDKYSNVMIIGHDPALANVAGFLTGRVVEKIPTAGIVEITFNTNHWSKVSEDSGNMQFSISPKMFA